MFGDNSSEDSFSKIFTRYWNGRDPNGVKNADRFRAERGTLKYYFEFVDRKRTNRDPPETVTDPRLASVLLDADVRVRKFLFEICVRPRVLSETFEQLRGRFVTTVFIIFVVARFYFFFFVDRRGDISIML